MSEKMKPCPKCGTSSQLIIRRGTSGAYVECAFCEAMKNKEGDIKAIAAWNRRAEQKGRE